MDCGETPVSRALTTGQPCRLSQSSAATRALILIPKAAAMGIQHDQHSKTRLSGWHDLRIRHLSYFRGINRYPFGVGDMTDVVFSSTSCMYIFVNGPGVGLCFIPKQTADARPSKIGWWSRSFAISNVCKYISSGRLHLIRIHTGRIPARCPDQIMCLPSTMIHSKPIHYGFRKLYASSSSEHSCYQKTHAIKTGSRWRRNTVNDLSSSFSSDSCNPS